MAASMRSPMTPVMMTRTRYANGTYLLHPGAAHEQSHVDFIRSPLCFDKDDNDRNIL